MKTLTKSLHTVTAATRVAEHIANTETKYFTAATLANRALEVLGYDFATFHAMDPTIEKITRECARIVGGRRVGVAA